MAVFDVEHRSESLSARIALTLVENGNAALAKKANIARSEGLPTLQASLLIHLREFDGMGGTVGHLADAMQLTPPTISDSMKALVRKGFLTRERSEEDGRVAFFKLTRKGSRLADRLSEWADPIEKSIAGLTREDQLALLGALTRVLRNQVEDGFCPAESMCASCEYFEVGSHLKNIFHCARREKAISLTELCTDCQNHLRKC
jgi:DNA-binding MarR family transcriptional regulator